MQLQLEQEKIRWSLMKLFNYSNKKPIYTFKILIKFVNFRNQNTILNEKNFL